MNIFLVDCDLGEAPGHTIRKATPASGGVLPIGLLLKKSSPNGNIFKPDLLIQKEHLGRKIFLSGLEYLECPKIFWSVDSHLNIFWHRWYGRLFDLILTPHPSLFKALPPEWRLHDVRNFSNPGYERQWLPHAKRAYTASFVGRIDKNRPERASFAKLLQDRHNVFPCTLPFLEMLERYDNTRILPNESIAHEFNFRITEGASCGCCVLTEDIGDDLYVNFEPGKETITYRDALEFDELISFLVAHPAIAEKIGMAAQQRVLAEHLPKHRLQTILQIAPSLAATSCPATDAERALALACIQWMRGYPQLHEHLPHFSKQLERYAGHPDVQAMQLRLYLENRQFDRAQASLACIHEALVSAPDELDGNATMLDLHTACAVAAIQLGNMPYFISFWKHYKHMIPNAETPKNQFQACLAWAEILAYSGRLYQAGFHFDPFKHCPETSLEMTQMACRYISGEEEKKFWIRQMATRCQNSPFIRMTLEYTAQMSIDSQDDWRASLSYGLACLRAYRLEEGLAEINMAKGLAIKAGEWDSFKKLWSR